MTNATDILYAEHALISKAIDIAKKAATLIDKNNSIYENVIKQLIDFFRKYADGFHHYKEEEILFPEMNKKNELLADGVVKEMFDNHDEFRQMLVSIENKLNKKQFAQAQQALEKYTEALLDHIAVENDEVFQMAESLFSDDELERMKFRFDDCDRELGNSYKQELEESLKELVNELRLTAG